MYELSGLYNDQIQVKGGPWEHIVISLSALCGPSLDKRWLQSSDGYSINKWHTELTSFFGLLKRTVTDRRSTSNPSSLAQQFQGHYKPAVWRYLSQNLAKIEI